MEIESDENFFEQTPEKEPKISAPHNLKTSFMSQGSDISSAASNQLDRSDYRFEEYKHLLNSYSTSAIYAASLVVPFDAFIIINALNDYNEYFAILCLCLVQLMNTISILVPAIKVKRWSSDSSDLENLNRHVKRINELNIAFLMSFTISSGLYLGYGVYQYTIYEIGIYILIGYGCVGVISIAFSVFYGLQIPKFNNIKSVVALMHIGRNNETRV